MPPVQPSWLVSLLLLMRGVVQPNVMAVDWKNDEYHSPAKAYNLQQLQELAFTDSYRMRYFNETLDQILRVRVPDTPGHNQVRQFIKGSLNELNFEVTEDSFVDQTPFGPKNFHNIIGTLNPNACKRLVFACHYDSKYDARGQFLGAIDSAVPCAMMLSMAAQLAPSLLRSQNDSITLQLIFFDGEEAFQTWTDTDSLYGSRHLAKKWHRQPFRPTTQQASCARGIVSELDRIELFVLLDLLGSPDPKFYSFYRETNPLFSRLIQIEEKLTSSGILRNRNSKRYFQRTMHFGGQISDDHVPFVQRDVPVLHIIPAPFPRVWHKNSDNRANLHFPTIYNLMSIFKVFIASYLHA